MKHVSIVFIDIGDQTVPAGRLTIIEDGRFSRSEFSYGRRYLERPDAVAIDPVQLPLVDKELITEAEFTLFNGIRDAAPDAWGRKLIESYVLRNFGRQALEAEFLLASQRGSRVGALQFGKTPASPSPVLDLSFPDASSNLGNLESFQKMVDLYTRGEDLPENLMDHIIPGSDLGGARPKGTIEIDGFPWLAKFGLERDRINMAGAEAACLDLCEMSGLEVCERDIIDVSGRKTLLVKRFDRSIDEQGRMNRKHMISGLTLLGQHEMDRGNSGYADLYDAIRREAKDKRGLGEDTFKRMLMNVLCGNTDDHYRNHAYLYDFEKGYRPSPVYDVTPSLQLSTTRKTFLHLGKAGSGREATLENAIAAGPSLGLSLEKSLSIADECSQMVAANWRKVMKGRGVSDKHIDLLEQSFSESGKKVKITDPFVQESLNRNYGRQGPR